ncbi:MAG: hypothetical protein HY271_05080 [Deltaproteobacteria bacterium]|nr:hypothetical protein [Deltaproteobacteria bacterium]
MRCRTRGTSACVAGVIALLSAAAGCMYLQPGLQRRIWDSYPNSEPLQVSGADPSTAGQLIYQQLRLEPRISTFLAGHGEPDTVQVLGARLAPKRFLLIYTRSGTGQSYRIVIDPSEDGLIARAPEPLPTSTPEPLPTVAPPGAKQTGRTHKPEPLTPPTNSCIPTAEQRLNCPIDHSRADCRVFCVCTPPFEWCR